MGKLNITGVQHDIVEDWPIHIDMEIEWELVDQQTVEVHAVYMLLANRTIIDGKPVHTIDRINVIDYGIDTDAIIDHIWENYVYE